MVFLDRKADVAVVGEMAELSSEDLGQDAVEHEDGDVAPGKGPAGDEGGVAAEQEIARDLERLPGATCEPAKGHVLLAGPSARTSS